MDFYQKGDTLHVAGRFSTADLDEFRAETEKLLRNNPDSAVALEMSKCTFMNSIAVGHILRVVKRLAEKNRRLTIKRPSQEVRIYLEVTKVSTLLDIVD